LRVRDEFALFCVTPATLVPMAALIVAPPVPLPELVIVPLWLTFVPVREMPLVELPSLFKIKLPPPVTLLETVKLPAKLVKVVPALLTLRSPVEMVSAEVVLFCVMPVTLEPTPPVMDTLPELLPELVIVPVLFTVVVESVMPLAVDPLFFKIKLPVPVTPPETVKVPTWLVKVVPPLLTVNPPVETVSADVELFCVIPVTLDPTPPVMDALPEPLPELVIVPVLFTAAVERVIAWVPPALIVRFAVPALVIPPERVNVFPVPVLPIVLSLPKLIAPA